MEYQPGTSAETVSLSRLRQNVGGSGMTQQHAQRACSHNNSNNEDHERAHTHMSAAMHVHTTATTTAMPTWTPCSAPGVIPSPVPARRAWRDDGARGPAGRGARDGGPGGPATRKGEGGWIESVRLMNSQVLSRPQSSSCPLCFSATIREKAITQKGWPKRVHCR